MAIVMPLPPLSGLQDGVSTVGVKLVLFVGEDGRCSPLSWGSNAITRVVRSPLVAETLALAYAVDKDFFCKTMIEIMCGFIPESLNIHRQLEPSESYELL